MMSRLSYAFTQYQMKLSVHAKIKNHKQKALFHIIRAPETVVI